MTALTLDNQLCFALYSASNAVIRLYRPLLEPFDLTYPQYLVMLALWQQDGVQLKALTEQTRLDPGTITPIVKRLESKGLLQRQSDPADERAKRVKVTAAGRAIKQPLSEAHQCLFEKYADPSNELMQLKQLCNNLVTRIKAESEAD